MKKDNILISVLLSKDERKALKQAALDNDTNVSALIRKWLADYEAKKARKAKREILDFKK